INLACKAILAAVTDINHAAEGAAEFSPSYSADNIVQIRSSSLRRQYFSEILETLEKKDLQLLRDVATRWSSTFLMIERATVLRDAIDFFLSSRRFPELENLCLKDPDWDCINLYKKILVVPHAFQQKLSGEATPTLSGAIPAFEAVISRWKTMQDDIPTMSYVIEAGIDKLESYTERISDTPAYMLAM
ncbi:hypothetical protein K435DRAFT_623206, partial [Dendrothele bispora CBS 962.96]